MHAETGQNKAKVSFGAAALTTILLVRSVEAVDKPIAFLPPRNAHVSLVATKLPNFTTAEMPHVQASPYPEIPVQQTTILLIHPAQAAASRRILMVLDRPAFGLDFPEVLQADFVLGAVEADGSLLDFFADVLMVAILLLEQFRGVAAVVEDYFEPRAVDGPWHVLVREVNGDAEGEREDYGESHGCVEEHVELWVHAFFGRVVQVQDPAGKDRFQGVFLRFWGALPVAEDVSFDVDTWVFV